MKRNSSSSREGITGYGEVPVFLHIIGVSCRIVVKQVFYPGGFLYDSGVLCRTVISILQNRPLRTTDSEDLTNGNLSCTINIVNCTGQI